MNHNIQKKIISLCGSQSELARRLGKNSQTVSVWFRTQVPKHWQSWHAEM